MEIDDEFMMRLRGRMDMEIDENDDDRAEAVRLTINVLEWYQEAILERADVRKLMELPKESLERYNQAESIIEDLYEVLEAFERTT